MTMKSPNETLRTAFINDIDASRNTNAGKAALKLATGKLIELLDRHDVVSFAPAPPTSGKLFEIKEGFAANANIPKLFGIATPKGALLYGCKEWGIKPRKNLSPESIVRYIIKEMDACGGSPDREEQRNNLVDATIELFGDLRALDNEIEDIRATGHTPIVCLLCAAPHPDTVTMRGGVWGLPTMRR